MDKNILFFLTPKAEVEYLLEDDTVRQAIEKMEYHNYASIPVLSKEGKYFKSISEGDLLRFIKKENLNLERAEDASIKDVPSLKDIRAIHVYKNMIDLLDIIVNQNFVPVLDDRENFIGIITRKVVIEYLESEIKKSSD